MSQDNPGRRTRVAMEALRELSQSIARDAATPRGMWRHEGLGLRLSRVTSPCDPTGQVYEPAFGLVIQGEKQLEQLLNDGRSDEPGRAGDEDSHG